MYVHDLKVHCNGVICPETLGLVHDVRDVWSSLYQGMPVIGPWLEQRVTWLIQSWLPEWKIGSGQVYDPTIPNIRSRSWDIIVYKSPKNGELLPPQASPNSGAPLVPKHLCCAVIDTKNNFSDVKKYASQPVFNLMNDAKKNQLEFLGNKISKCVLACMTNGAPETIEKQGSAFGLNVFVIGQYKASKVMDAENRQQFWTLNATSQSPLVRFKNELLEAAARWEQKA